MRLSSKEVESIKEAVFKVDDKAQIYLFGSRTDDNKKGGDIDLLILSSNINLKHKLKILRDILNKIGEQKIDITIAKDDKEPFVRIALNTGILL